MRPAIILVSGLIFISVLSTAKAQNSTDSKAAVQIIDSPVQTDILVRLATRAAARDGLPLGRHTYLDELTDGKGGEPVAGYSSIGFFRNGKLLRAYAERDATGDFVELTTCTVYRYPEMLREKYDVLGLAYHPPLRADVHINQVAAEIGCAKLHAVSAQGAQTGATTQPAAALAVLTALPRPAPGTFVPTSTMVKLGKLVARDLGLDPAWVDLTEIQGRNGPDRLDGYDGIVLSYSPHPVAWIMVRATTGDVIDNMDCRLFRFPDLGAFRRERMRLTGSPPPSVANLTDETLCSHLRIDTRPYPPEPHIEDQLP